MIAASGAPIDLEPPRLDARARRTMALLYRRLMELGLWRHIRSVGGAVTTGAGGAQFATDDNNDFLEGLLSTKRFCRDTPRGGILHPGQISVREISSGAGLHLSLDADNRIYVHVDRVSPAIGVTSDGTCKYDRSRSLAHVRREVFPLVTRTYRPLAHESKSGRRARFDLYDAQRAWCEAVEADRTKEAIEAGVRLAGLLDVESESARRRAETLYQEAIESGDSELAPAAAFGLGILLEVSQDFAGAEAAYRQAVESEHHEFAPWAAYHMGMMMERRDKYDQAKAAYQWAMSLGHPDITSWAALRLADLVAVLGDHAGAVEIYELLISLRHPECASLGAIGAARLLHYLGRDEPAAQAYKRAIALGPAHTARLAREELALLLGETEAGHVSSDDGDRMGR